MRIIATHADAAMQISPLFSTDNTSLFFTAFKSNNYDCICLMAEALRHSRLPLCELHFFGFTYSEFAGKLSGRIECAEEAVTALMLKMVALKIENNTIALYIEKVRDLAKSRDFDRNSWQLCDRADEHGLNPMTIKEILELVGIQLKKAIFLKAFEKSYSDF